PHDLRVQPIHSHLARVFPANDTARAHASTLSLHDALPILLDAYNEELAKITSDPEKYLSIVGEFGFTEEEMPDPELTTADLCAGDRKSTRLNSSHVSISYAVFCLKKKITIETERIHQYRLL